MSKFLFSNVIFRICRGIKLERRSILLNFNIRNGMHGYDLIFLADYFSMKPLVCQLNARWGWNETTKEKYKKNYKKSVLALKTVQTKNKYPLSEKKSYSNLIKKWQIKGIQETCGIWRIYEVWKRGITELWNWAKSLSTETLPKGASALSRWRLVLLKFSLSLIFSCSV